MLRQQNEVRVCPDLFVWAVFALPRYLLLLHIIFLRRQAQRVLSASKPLFMPFCCFIRLLGGSRTQRYKIVRHRKDEFSSTVNLQLQNLCYRASSDRFK